MNFKLGKAVKPDRVFVVRRSAMSSRFDPHFYIPSLVALEQRALAAGARPLRRYVSRIAGGATPSKADGEDNYAEKSNGVPFVRVQNLSTTGELNLDDCVFIKRAVHETQLERSRVQAGDLLIKITGVGRMAVASVVPEGFEGNINQHIVVCKTGSRAASETLAAYLNLDFVERLAFRRTTGGTRPALDYPALLSIPIIFDPRVPELSRKATGQYLRSENQARQLLASIDDLLLAELGIKFQPAPPPAPKARIFLRKFSELAGDRFDPIAHQPRRQLIEAAFAGGRFPVARLRALVRFRKDVVDELPPGVPYLGLENVDGATGEHLSSAEKESVGTALEFSAGQILFPKLRPYLNKTHLAGFAGVCSTEFHVLESRELLPAYLAECLRSRPIVALTSMLMTGNTLPRLQTEDVWRLPVPKADVKTQQRIVAKIADLRAEAKTLRATAAAQLAAAKQEIEAMILGGDASS